VHQWNLPIRIEVGLTSDVEWFEHWYKADFCRPRWSRKGGFGIRLPWKVCPDDRLEWTWDEVEVVIPTKDNSDCAAEPHHPLQCCCIISNTLSCWLPESQHLIVWNRVSMPNCPQKRLSHTQLLVPLHPCTYSSENSAILRLKYCLCGRCISDALFYLVSVSKYLVCGHIWPWNDLELTFLTLSWLLLDKITSEMDSPHQETLKKRYYTPIYDKWFKTKFSTRPLAAILDLCKLQKLPKVAVLATKLNLF